MLFLSPFTESKTILDPRFSSRGADSHRQGPIHDSPYIAIALEKQIAYEGYKGNIDVFLAATHTGQYHSINLPGIDLEDLLSHSFPLALPRTVISFKQGVPLPVIKSIVEKAQVKTTVTKVDGINGHPHCYMLETPNKLMLKFCEPYVVPFAPRQEGYAQLSETLSAANVLGYIDLYLRTNTYPAFKADLDVLAPPPLHITAYKRPAEWLGTEAAKKLRYTSVNMNHEMGESKKKEKEDGLWVGGTSDKDVQLPVDVAESVALAKPSPVKTSAASWSLPKDVPSMPGQVFPYFAGSLTGSKETLRSIVGKHFLRLFGAEPKKHYINYRNLCGGFANTSTGIIMSHILVGMDISIETQTKLHLLFDNSTYLGFCILGAKWCIARGNAWHTPLVSNMLRAELDTIKTHESSISDIISKMREMNVLISKDEEKEMNPVILAGLLASMDLSSHDKDEKKEIEKWFNDRVGSLDFGTRPVNFGADTYAATLEDIAGTHTLNHHVHFPPAEQYPMLVKREAICLARFGFLVPSLVVDRGVEIAVITREYADAEKGKALRTKVKKILVAMKPLKRAVEEFKQFRATKTIYQSSAERAATYRQHVLSADPKDRFLMRAAVPIASLERLLSSDTDKVYGGEKKGKEKVIEDFAVIDVPDF